MAYTRLESYRRRRRQQVGEGKAGKKGRQVGSRQWQTLNNTDARMGLPSWALFKAGSLPQCLCPPGLGSDRQSEGTGQAVGNPPEDVNS